mmetsp:Transcript_7184/g.17864  ORF Transcript_7184/g.17864 Transcript_7184/m.17864 type:complete len:328 (-) Transcript_7184:153-1136(-)
MRLRRRWHGISCLLSSSRPVSGEVLWFSSHCSMALRSYVWPSIVLTGSVMISAVIEHMNSLGTSASLASDGPAAPLLPPSAVARSNASAFASAATATATSRALVTAATCTASCSAASRTCFAAANLAASAAASCSAPHSASCSAPSGFVSHRACASAPTPPSRVSIGAASSVDSLPPALAARSAASARSAADATGVGAAAGGELAAAAGGTSLGSYPAAAEVWHALFFFLYVFQRACSASSSTSGFSIDPSARACAACSARNKCGAGTAVAGLACRAGRRGRPCRTSRCWPGRALKVRRMQSLANMNSATVAIAPSTSTESAKTAGS